MAQRRRRQLRRNALVFLGSLVCARRAVLHRRQRIHLLSAADRAAAPRSRSRSCPSRAADPAAADSADHHQAAGCADPEPPAPPPTPQPQPPTPPKPQPPTPATVIAAAGAAPTAPVQANPRRTPAPTPKPTLAPTLAPIAPPTPAPDARSAKGGHRRRRPRQPSVQGVRRAADRAAPQATRPGAPLAPAIAFPARSRLRPAGQRRARRRPAARPAAARPAAAAWPAGRRPARLRLRPARQRARLRQRRGPASLRGGAGHAAHEAFGEGARESPQMDPIDATKRQDIDRQAAVGGRRAEVPRLDAVRLRGARRSPASRGSCTVARRQSSDTAPSRRWAARRPRC